jgi:cell wall assembly regulator SMI1
VLPSEHPATEVDVVAWLVDHVPELGPFVAEHVADSDELLAYLVVEGDFVPWFVERVRAGDCEAAGRFLAAVETLLTAEVAPPTRRVWNLVGVALVERLVLGGDVDDVVEAARPWMGASTSREFDRTLGFRSGELRPAELALSRPLDAATLDRLVRCLGDLGVAGIDDRQPGLSTDEIRALTRELPRALPSEVQLWFSRWTWGEDLYDMLWNLRYHPLPNCMFLYDQALEWERRYRRVGPYPGQRAAHEYAPGWLPLWFALSQQEGPAYIAVDLSASDGIIAPVLAVDRGGGETKCVAGSVGEFVANALDDIDAGKWLYDRENHNWEPKGGWAASAERQ